MYKIIFEFITDQLDLPLNALYSFIVMAIIGEIAFKIAYEKTGLIIKREYVSTGKRRLIHWGIRLLAYLGLWLGIKAVIWVYGFASENMGVTIFSLGCVMAIILTARISNYIDEKKRLSKIRGSYVYDEEKGE